MGRARGTYGKDDGRVQGFGGKTRMKETTWKAARNGNINLNPTKRKEERAVCF